LIFLVGLAEEIMLHCLIFSISGRDIDLDWGSQTRGPQPTCDDISVANVENCFATNIFPKLGNLPVYAPIKIQT